MKKFVKALATICVLVMAFSLTACTTYTKNGSVIQDVKFDVTYTVDGETTTVNSTISLYKTFAPKTCDRIIGLIEDGFYDNTALTLSKQQDYIVVGGFDFDTDYIQKSYTGEGLRGEFTSAGRESKLKVQVGALVMLREFDTDEGEPKYDTAKASFAIVIANSGTFTNDKFCVFGFMDIESVELLQDAFTDNSADEEGYFRAKYLGDRNNGVLTSNNAFEYYFNKDSKYYNFVGGDYEEMVYTNEGDADYFKYKTFTDTKKFQDIFVLPKTVFKVKAELCKGENKK